MYDDQLWNNSIYNQIQPEEMLMVGSFNRESVTLFDMDRFVKVKPLKTYKTSIDKNINEETVCNSGTEGKWACPRIYRQIYFKSLPSLASLNFAANWLNP